MKGFGGKIQLKYVREPSAYFHRAYVAAFICMSGTHVLHTPPPSFKRGENLRQVITRSRCDTRVN